MPPLLNVVVDLFHLNTVNPSDGFHQMKNAGILGVIHKATQGTDFVDPEYDERRQRALSVDLLWGAYHFGTGEDGTDQANHLLNIASPQPGQLMALDFEPNLIGATMTRAQAEAFVTHIHGVTGVFPLLYSGQSFLQDQLGGLTTGQSVLCKCPLWIARYDPALPVLPLAFSSFALWQYTDGAAGLQPHSVPGIGRCNRSKFNGDINALRAFWQKAD